MKPRLVRIALIGTAALLPLSACGTTDSGASTDTTVAVATTATNATPDSADEGTVDANTASVAEMTAAFETAGIPNAARWAREVEEYRPYPTDDPTMADLRQELAKYNPTDEVVDQIVATLDL
jgi:hypothetical protein